MGAWGTGILSNDYALDIKTDYQALLAFGTPKEEAYRLVKECYLEDPDEDVEFWFFMAAYQYKYGILEPEVKENALKCINDGLDEPLWEGADKRTLKSREKVRQDLKAMLLSPPLPIKKVPKPYVEKPRWQIGDIILSRIVSKYSKEQGDWYYNKYVLYRVTELDRRNVSTLLPGLAINEWVKGVAYDWIGDEPPDVKILEDLKYFVPAQRSKDRKLANFALDWIPRNQKFSLFAREHPSSMPNKSDIEITAAGTNISREMEMDPDHFKSLYEKYRSI